MAVAVAVAVLRRTHRAVDEHPVIAEREEIQALEHVGILEDDAVNPQVSRSRETYIQTWPR